MSLAIHKTTNRKGFLDERAALPIDDLLDHASRASGSEGRRALEESPLSLEAAAVLLRMPADDLPYELFVRANAGTQSVFGRTVHLLAPCYISTFCVNSCRYCPISPGAPIATRWLSPPRIVTEMRFLERQGFRHVVLVAAESPAIATDDYIVETLQNSRTLIPQLDLNVGAASEEEFGRWREAGAGGAVCFQETYSRPVYEYMHTAGPKADYDHRLGSLERAGRAGIRRLGMGVFLGLAEPAGDLLSLIAHARRLGDLFPQAQLTINLPRVRRTSPPRFPAWGVDDEELIRYIAVLRLALPQARIAVSTREPEWLRSRMLFVGVTEMSVYMPKRSEALMECQHDDGEIEVRDHRSACELRWDLEDRRYRVEWCISRAA